MTQRRNSKGHFVKGSMPWNKGKKNSQKGIIFTCQFCGESKPIEEMRIVGRFFPPLPACADCRKLLDH